MTFDLLSGSYLEAGRCGKLMLMIGALVGGCSRATSWCDLYLTFDIAIVTFEILSGLYLGNCKV